jgi:hypothetical protein
LRIATDIQIDATSGRKSTWSIRTGSRICRSIDCQRDGQDAANWNIGIWFEECLNNSPKFLCRAYLGDLLSYIYAYAPDW